MIGPPEVTRAGTAITFAWPLHRLRLSAFRERDGDTRCEIEAETIDGEMWAPLTGLTVLNLTAARSRGELAKHLNTRDDSFPWHDAIEHAALLAVRFHREGGPIVPLASVTAPTSIRYLIDRIIPADETTILFGDGEAGKSLFSMFIAVAVATGTPLPRGLGPEQPGAVLYLDWESDPTEHSRRLQLISRGLGLDEAPANVFYRQCVRPLHEDADTLAREVVERGVELTIIDSLAVACGDDPSSPGAALRTMNAARQLGGTRLGLGHLNRVDRERPQANQTTFGSVFWRNAARAMWQLVRSEDAPAGSAPFALYNRKANNAPRERWPLGMAFTFGADAYGLEPYDVRASDTLAGGALTGDRIRQALRLGSLDTNEIAEALGIDAAAVRMACQRMHDVVTTEAAIPGRNGRPARWGLKA
ncbi:MAG: AAA family ATPase [Dehalococcoidia bacterium]|nr:AAA family ATPase [Dehalococcoidia bacterium]